MRSSILSFVDDQIQQKILLSLNKLPWSKRGQEINQSIKTDLHAALRFGIDTFEEFNGLVPSIDFLDKQVLDIGCGLAGSLHFVIRRGAKEALGIDLRAQSLRDALTVNSQLPNPITTPRIMNANSAYLPFKSQYFDIVTSIYAFEHIFPLNETIKEVYRVLKFGGETLIAFPTYLSPWGAHVQDWLAMPWPHLFFSDSAIAGAVREIEQRKSLLPKYDLHAQIPIEPSFAHVNKLSYSGFKNALNNEPWSKIEIFSPAIAHTSKFRILGQTLQKLANEIFTSVVIAHLTK